MTALVTLQARPTPLERSCGLSETVSARGSLTVPAEALDLLHELDLRGCVCLSGKAGSLRVARQNGDGPPELSSDERQRIGRWKAHLLALVAYCA